jgi:DeoR/GlpR family transcriptional regulator of sugar metabolism
VSSKDRRAIIAERLKAEGEASIADLAQRFGTSEMTIRRDLELLEIEGLARRIRGGAISTQSRSYEPPILQRSTYRADAKRRIGAAAAALLKDDETVVLDVGTTTLEMAKAIDSQCAVTVITGSLLIATALDGKQNIRTIVTGGVLRRGEMSLVGSRAEASFADLNCDTVFLGVAGVSYLKGLTEYNLDDAMVKQAALVTGRRVVVLADATKIGRVAFVSVCPLTSVDLLITDASPDGPTIRSIKELGVEVLHVEPFTKETTP